MVGLILLLLAWFLLLPATLINVILVASKSGVRGWAKALGGYFKNTARNMDIFGADEFRTLWNAVLIKENGVKFRGDGRTISYYLGANQASGTLSGFGRFVAWVCDTVDKEHCRMAYENDGVR